MLNKIIILKFNKKLIHFILPKRNYIIFFVVGAIHSGIQDFCLALSSVITPGRSLRPYVVVGIELGPDTSKVSTLPI